MIMGNLRLTTALTMLLITVLFASPHAMALDSQGLYSNGYRQQIVDGRNIFVHELREQTFEQLPGGFWRQTIYSFHYTFDSSDQPVRQRYPKYTIVISADDEVVRVIDEFDIPRQGTQLSKTSDGVSFFDHLDQKVSIRRDGSYRITTQRGKGPSYETWPTGKLRKRYDSDGNSTHLYGYQSVVSGSGVFQKRRLELVEYVGTNSRGKKEHWAKTATDAQTGRQTWMLQNGIGGKSVAMPGVHRIYVDVDSGIVIEDRVTSTNSEGQKIIESTTRHALDGSRLQTSVAEDREGWTHRSIKLFGSPKGPLYALYSKTRGRGTKQEVEQITISTGPNRYVSRDGSSWVQEGTADNEAKYYRGAFDILSDGSFYQKIHETDPNGKRLEIDGKPVVERTFIINTKGQAIEIVAKPNGLHDTSAKIVRDREGDILKTIDMRGRTTSFAYSAQRGEDGGRLIYALNDHDGNVWKTDNDGKTWYQPETGRRRDSSETMTMSVDRGTGSVTYEDWRYFATVHLDGTTRWKAKALSFAQVYNADGQIVSTTSNRDDVTTFYYDDSRALNGYKTTLASTKPEQKEKIGIHSVDWNGNVTYRREFATNRIEKYEHLNDDTIKVFGHRGQLEKVTHDSGLKCEYEYRREKLTGMKRTTRHGVQLFFHGEEDEPRIIAVERVGTETKRTDTKLAGFTFESDGKLVLDYEVTPENDGPLRQTFYPDGTRRVLKQDSSVWRFDKADRPVLIQHGVSRKLVFFYKALRYQGDMDLPTEVNWWKRGSEPVGQADEQFKIYEWSDNDLKWSGLVHVVWGRLQLPGHEEKGVHLHKVGDNVEHNFANRAMCLKNTNGRIMKCRDAQGLSFIFDYDESGQLAEASSFTGTGEKVKLKEIYKVGEHVEKIELHPTTGQPTFTDGNGTKTIHVFNGVVVTLDKQTYVSAVLPQGTALELNKESTDGVVSQIDYDPEASVVRFSFTNGKRASVNEKGHLVVLEESGKLVRTSGIDAANVFEYRYSGDEIDLFTQKTTLADGNVNIVVMERTGNAGTPRWRRRGETAGDDAFNVLVVDKNTGRQLRIHSNGKITEVDPDGVSVEKNIVESDVRSMVTRDQSGLVLSVLREAKDEISFFRNDAGEVLLIDYEYSDSVQRVEPGRWKTSFGNVYSAKFKVDNAGNQIWTNRGVTVTRFPDGERRVELPDGSSTLHSADRSKTTHSHPPGGNVKTTISDTRGRKEIVFRNGERHIQFPNEFVVRKIDSNGAEVEIFSGLIHVAEFGTTTEINFNESIATVFQRNGSAAVVLTRLRGENGRNARYLYNRKRVDLSEFGGREPHSIGPEVGFGRITGESVLASDLSYLTRRDVLSKSIATKSTSNTQRPAPVLPKPALDDKLPLPAAEKGDATAQYEMGQHYFTKRDYANAKLWLAKAAAQGNVQAKSLLRIVEAKLKN